MLERCLLTFCIFAPCVVAGVSSLYRLLGENVTLTPATPAAPTHILWKHNGDKVVEFDGAEERVYRAYRNRITLDWHSAEVTIKTLRHEDSGEYELETIDQKQKLYSDLHNVMVLDEVAEPTITCTIHHNANSSKTDATLQCSSPLKHSQSSAKFAWESDTAVRGGPQLSIILQGDSDKSVYTCKVSNPRSSKQATFTASDCFKDQGSSSNVGLIVGLSILAVVIIALVIGGIYYKKCRHKKASPSTSSGHLSQVSVDVPPSQLTRNVTESSQIGPARKSVKEIATHFDNLLILETPADKQRGSGTKTRSHINDEDVPLLDSTTESTPQRPQYPDHSHNGAKPVPPLKSPKKKNKSPPPPKPTQNEINRALPPEQPKSNSDTAHVTSLEGELPDKRVDGLEEYHHSGLQSLQKRPVAADGEPNTQHEEEQSSLEDQSLLGTMPVELVTTPGEDTDLDQDLSTPVEEKLPHSGSAEDLQSDSQLCLSVEEQVTEEQPPPKAQSHPSTTLVKQGEDADADLDQASVTPPEEKLPHSGSAEDNQSDPQLDHSGTKIKPVVPPKPKRNSFPALSSPQKLLDTAGSEATARDDDDDNDDEDSTVTSSQQDPDLTLPNEITDLEETSNSVPASAQSEADMEDMSELAEKSHDTDENQQENKRDQEADLESVAAQPTEDRRPDSDSSGCLETNKPDSDGEVKEFEQETLADQQQASPSLIKPSEEEPNAEDTADPNLENDHKGVSESEEGLGEASDSKENAAKPDQDKAIDASADQSSSGDDVDTSAAEQPHEGETGDSREKQR